jgi:hypothetical protein
VTDEAFFHAIRHAERGKYGKQGEGKYVGREVKAEQGERGKRVK